MNSPHLTCRSLLGAFLKDRSWSYFVGFLFLLLTNLIVLTLPRVLGSLTDLLAEGHRSMTVLGPGLGLLVLLTFVQFGTRFLWRQNLIGNARRVEVYLRDHLFRHLQTLPVSFYTQRKTGELMAYAVNDVQALRMAFGPGTLQAVDGLLIAAISVGFLTGMVSVPLMLATMAPLVVAGVLTLLLAKPIRPRFREVQESYAKISDLVQETLGGIRVLKSFAQESATVQKLAGESQSRIEAQQRLVLASARLGPAVQACAGVSFFVLIVFGGRMVHDGTLTVGDFVAMNLYLLTILGPVVNLSRIIEFLQKGVASFQRLEELFSIRPVASPQVIAPGELRGEVVIRNLTFRYPDAETDALRGIDLDLYPGKLVGIVGATGSGKTTLVSLLLRLHDVDDGMIRLDGRDINEWPLADLRESIGYVPQDHFLFSTTIRSNIEFFRPLYSDDEIEEASRQSGILDSIAAFPEGFDTQVGERGVSLSGGQKQRIGIARALVKDPALLILDDCLSAVDARTEAEVLDNLRRYLAERTGIVVSHRVSTVRTADEIVVLDQGCVVERGTHDQLVARDGPYARLCTIQGVVS